MSLSAKYQAFLATPTADALAQNASINYITTLTTINEPAAITKHLTVQEKLLKKKGQKVLSAIESANGLCLDVETTIEFVSSGGAYLPGLDDNFVADRTVTFPVVHIVHFDSEHKVSQIRLYWDQGSLLKQIDVIGARARNWPIRDGKDQARLIASSANSTSTSTSTGQPASAASSRRSTTNSRNPDEVIISERPNSSRSSVSTKGDPHASLSLFQPRDVNQESTFPKPTVSRALSAKPPPRDLGELFAGEGAGTPIISPSKERPIKAGSGKNYKPNRLFEEGEVESVPTPMSVKTNAKKYDHFEFGEGEDAQATPKAHETARSGSKSKHMSQWDFEDFVTPDKPKLKVLPQAVRHFGWSDDEDETSPVRRPVVHKARPDQESHFEFKDDGTPAAAKPKQTNTKGRAQNKGLGLYQDHILHSTSDDEEQHTGGGDVKEPLAVINNENRKKDFGSQWEMGDKSPNPQTTTFNGNGNGAQKHPTEDQKKVLKGLDANWGHFEQSPEQAKERKIYKTAGDGMGGHKATTRNWGIGDEENEAQEAKAKPVSKPTQDKNFWDF